jgi:hypothetical protein
VRPIGAQLSTRAAAPLVAGFAVSLGTNWVWADEGVAINKRTSRNLFIWFAFEKSALRRDRRLEAHDSAAGAECPAEYLAETEKCARPFVMVTAVKIGFTRRLASMWAIHAPHVADPN